MTAECPAECSDARGFHNFCATRDGGNGHAPAERFSHGDQVRLNPKMLAGKPFPGARKTGLHFVSNEENPVSAANFLQKRKVIWRRNDESAFTQDWLGDDRSHGFGRDAAFEGILEIMRECLRSRALLAAIGIGERYAIHVAGKRLKACLIGMRLAG